MEEVLAFLRDSPTELALVLVFSAAALEYLLPPLPADSVVLASSLLVVAGSVSFPVIYVVVVAGGAAGAFAHYQIGRLALDGQGRLRVARGLERWIGADALPRFVAAFRRYGYWVLVLNRAFPGVRAVTFLAAGAARLPLGATMLAGLVSNLAWSLFLLGVGVQVGSEWELIERTFLEYQRWVFAAGGGGLVLFLAVQLWQRLRRA